MKTFRLWLLLLLAVLLPVRGALAVAMHCSEPGSQVQAEAQLAKHSHDQLEAAAGGHGHQQEAAQHDHANAQDSDGGGHQHAAAADKCNLCSASCSATGLVSGSMTFAEPQPVSAVFPHLYAPPPSFVPDGQERPPRTI